MIAARFILSVGHRKVTQRITRGFQGLVLLCALAVAPLPVASEVASCTTDWTPLPFTNGVFDDTSSKIHAIAVGVGSDGAPVYVAAPKFDYLVTNAGGTWQRTFTYERGGSRTNRICLKNCLHYVDGRFVVYFFENNTGVGGNNGSSVLISHDGDNWSWAKAYNEEPYVTYQPGKIVKGNGNLVATMHGHQRLMHNTIQNLNRDFVDWTERLDLKPAEHANNTHSTATGLAFGLGTFVAVAGAGVVTSVNGITWTRHSQAEALIADPPFTGLVNETSQLYDPFEVRYSSYSHGGNFPMGLAFGNGRFVALFLKVRPETPNAEDAQFVVLTTDDLITWTQETAPNPFNCVGKRGGGRSVQWSSCDQKGDVIIFGDGAFLVTLETGQWSSVNGVEWTEVVGGVTLDPYSKGNPRFDSDAGSFVGVFIDESPENALEGRPFTVASGAMSCTCNAGFEGDDCGTDINECTAGDGVVCGGASSCVDGVNKYTCNCASGWAGGGDNAVCTDTDGCMTPVAVDCSGHGACSDVAAPGTGYVCACTDGYVGSDCAYHDDTTCSGHGNAAVDGTCMCNAGFEGDDCGTGIDGASSCIDGCALSPGLILAVLGVASACVVALGAWTLGRRRLAKRDGGRQAKDANTADPSMEESSSKPRGTSEDADDQLASVPVSPVKFLVV
jgi:hypothetical protein